MAMDMIFDKLRSWRGAALLGAVAMLLAGCASTGGYGGYPGSYGQQPDRYPGQYGNQYGDQLVGTVQGVDRSYNRIVLDVQDRSGYGRGNQVAVQYDQRTRLYFRGQQLAVEGLERGDVIRVDAATTGGRLWARSIEVLRDVREQGGYGSGHGSDYGNGYGNTSELRGSVAHVDPRAQVIGLDGPGYGGGSQVRYDGRTVVEFQGRRYRPEDLERGDIVRVQARRLGNQWLAERIWVERDRSRY
jgi:hypothetical protein